MLDPEAVAGRARALLGSMRGFRRGTLRVKGFRLNYGEGQNATLGIHDSRVGSAYSPFQVVESARGALLIEWSDGKLSRAALDGNTGDDLGPALAAAAESRYRDDEARQFAPPPKRVPATRVYHPAVGRIVDGAFRPLYDLVELIVSRGRASGVEKIAGSVQAAIGVSVVATSKGLFHLSRSSEYRFGFAYDSELWDGRGRRLPLTLAEASRVIDRAVAYLKALRARVEAGEPGERQVLWLPQFAGSLFDAYLIGNLEGAAVANGRSAFKAEDFRVRRQVFRDDLRVGVDPTEPLSLGSFRMTAEGIPARKETYIDRGRLLLPIVGLKYGRRLGLRPTTPPAAMESVRIEGPKVVSLRRAFRLLGDGGLAVIDALGLHTQDASSGDFSLTAPQAMVARDGDLHGSAKVVLAGNFFALLRDRATMLVKVPGQAFPGLLVKARVAAG